MNSCKQAIAHCSGKRHRRRQKQLLQSNPTNDATITGSIPPPPGPTYTDMNCVSPTNCTFIPSNMAPTGFAPAQNQPYIYNFPATYTAPPTCYSVPYNNCDTTYLTTVNSPSPSGYCSGSYQGSVSSYVSGMQTAQSGSSQSLLSPASGSDGGSEGSVDIATTVDPVTKAVIENVMGKKFAKKRCSSAFCETCHLCFNSHRQLEAHLLGSKHNKRIRSMTILNETAEANSLYPSETSSVTGSTVQESVEGKRVLVCEICNVKVNSPLQLKAHSSGTKHRQRAQPNEIKTTGNNGASETPNNDRDTNNENSSTDANTETTRLPESSPPTANNNNNNKEEMTTFASKTNKTGKFYCQVCDVTVNSEVQLQQHTASKRHLDKQAGRPVKTKFKPRFFNGAKKLSLARKHPSTSTMHRIEQGLMKKDVTL